MAIGLTAWYRASGESLMEGPVAEGKSATAIEVRTLLHFARYGILSTNSVAMAGFPFGSVTPYLIDGDGALSIYISHLAEHYRNLTNDKRASLTVVDPFGHDDPQAHARATVLASFVPAPKERSAELLKAYERRFPGSVNYELTHDFMFMTGTIERVRWIGGFGDIRWVDAAAVVAARPDSVAEVAWEAIQHMNQDHGDAVALLARKFGSFPAAGVTASMVGLSSTGMTIRAVSSGKSELVTVPFPAPVVPESLRAAVVALVAAARQ